MRWLAILILALVGGPLFAFECSEVEFEGLPFTLCEVDAREEPLSLFLNDGSGRPYGSFAAVEAENGPLAFAMNAGMYHDDRRPVGLFRQDGEDLAPLVTRAGPGNFGLLPNGLLCLNDEGAFVVESLAYEAGARDCEAATQSGPMLVIDGELHPRFLPDSDSRHIRNGVGTSADGSRAVFAISGRPVTFTSSRGCSATGWGCRRRCTSTAACRGSTLRRSGATTGARGWGRSSGSWPRRPRRRLDPRGAGR